MEEISQYLNNKIQLVNVIKEKKNIENSCNLIEPYS